MMTTEESTCESGERDRRRELCRRILLCLAGSTLAAVLTGCGPEGNTKPDADSDGGGGGY